VVAVRDGLPGPQVWLVLRAQPDRCRTEDLLSNAPADIARARLVRTSGLRWPIERCFEVGKQELGMGDMKSLVRGWHHHMTLVVLALGLSGAAARPV